ncbi:transglutaminase family protein [bacterium]|nr:transglutaminase family protein [bacterium]
MTLSGLRQLAAAWRARRQGCRRYALVAAVVFALLLPSSVHAAPVIKDHYLTCRIYGVHVGYMRLDLSPQTDRKQPRQAYYLELDDVRDYNPLGLSVREEHRWQVRLAADLSLVSFECDTKSKTSPDFPETRLLLRGRFDEHGRGRLETDAPSGMDIDAGGPLFLYDLLPLLDQAGTLQALKPYTASIVPATLVPSSTTHLSIDSQYAESVLIVERDDSGVPQRLVMNEDLFEYEWKAEPAERATAPPRMLSAAEQEAVAARMPAGGIVPQRALDEPERTRLLRLYLHFPRERRPIPSGLRQAVTAVDWNTAEITISARRLDPADGDLAPYLAPDLFANSRHPDIQKAAREALRGLSDEPAKAARLTHYVYQKVQYEVCPGLPVASRTLRYGAGDCTELSTLYAALARAAGLPCRIVAGLVYRNGHFHYHAWNEVAVQTPDGRLWLPQDPSLGLSDVDATHIVLVEGNVDRQIALGPLIGKLSIDILEAQ